MQKFVRQFHYVDDQHLPFIRGIGLGTGSQEYYWDARHRKESMIVLQVTLSGQGTVVRDQTTLTLRKHQAFFAKIPGNYTYYGEDWQFLFIEFSAGMTQWLDQPFMTGSLTDMLVGKLQETVEKLRTGEWSVTENAKMAFVLFLEIKEAMQAAKRQLTNSQAIKQHLDTHYFEDIGLDDLANSFSLSKYQIIRQFEAAYGIPPIQYMKKVRVIQSLPMLWEGKPIREVAQAVGFATGNYFSKVFKKELGLSPSEYKQQKQYY